MTLIFLITSEVTAQGSCYHKLAFFAGGMGEGGEESSSNFRRRFSALDSFYFSPSMCFRTDTKSMQCNNTGIYRKKSTLVEFLNVRDHGCGSKWHCQQLWENTPRLLKGNDINTGQKIKGSNFYPAFFWKVSVCKLNRFYL